jgi:hypothetical protein
LFERVKNANVTVKLENDEIVFETTQKQTARVNEDGIVEVS